MAASAVEADYVNDLWISTNATGKFLTSGDKGTLDTPLDGSTAANFDSNMDHVPPYSTVHIMAGIYDTAGAAVWKLKSGQHLLGSGMNNTILRMSRSQLEASGPEGSTNGGLNVWNVSVIGIYGGVADCVFEDMTLDANCQGLHTRICGLDMGGTHNQARRIKVINCAGYGGECQGIFVHGYDPYVNSSNNIVEECEISDFAGGDQTWEPIACWVDIWNTSANSGFVCDTLIKNNRLLGDPLFFGGYAISAPYSGAIIEGNYVSHFNVVFYGEGGFSDAMVAHNNFYCCGEVCNITLLNSGDHMNNVTFADNQITLTNYIYPANSNLPWEAFYLAAAAGVTARYTNIVVVGNSVSTLARPASLPLYQDFFDAYNISGLTIVNNTIDSGFAHVSIDSSCSNVRMENNYDRLGNYFPLLNTSPTVGGVSVSSYALGLMTVSTTANMLQTLTLPVDTSSIITNQGVFNGRGTIANSTNFTGLLAGDVTGSQGATVVGSVGGQTAANVASGVSAANAATSANTANAILKRDGSGNFSAGSMTLASGLTLGGNLSQSAGQAYVYDGVNLAYGVTSLGNYFFGDAGNFTMTGSINTAMGYTALSLNTTGYGNTAVGADSMTFNKTGAFNVAIGAAALQNGTNGTYDVAVGRGSLSSMTGGWYNTAVGDQTLDQDLMGSYNTAVGGETLFYNTTGWYNTAVGVLAQYYNAAGNNNIALGYAAGINVTNGSNDILIGNGGLPNDNNIIRIGTNQTDAYIAGTLHLASNLMVAGTNSAGYFSGNGGGLTNVPASSLTGSIIPTNVLPVSSLPIYGYSLTTNWICPSNNLYSVNNTNTPISLSLPAGTYQYQVTVTVGNVAASGTGGGMSIGYVIAGGPSYINTIVTIGEANTVMYGNVLASASWPPYLNTAGVVIGGSAATFGQFVYMGQLALTNDSTYTVCAGSRYATTNPFVVYQGSGMTFTRIK